MPFPQNHHYTEQLNHPQLHLNYLHLFSVLQPQTKEDQKKRQTASSDSEKGHSEVGI